MEKTSKSQRKKYFIRSVVLFYNDKKPDAAKLVRSISGKLRSLGVSVLMGDHSEKRLIPSADLAIALGGDGTMLRVARLVGPRSIPLMGINIGGLGFLSAMESSQFQRDLNTILSGGFAIEERWMSRVQAYYRGKKIFGPHIGLNDCVIRSGDTARAITLTASCESLFVAEYFGDGLIISTPTGSTAYALAAGGPVVDPRLGAFIVTPICPHTLTQRSLIIPSQYPVVVRMGQRYFNERQQAQVSIDGQVGFSLRVDAEVHIHQYEKPLKLLVHPQRSYFEVLRRKLKWGER